MTPAEYLETFQRIPLEIEQELPDCYLCRAGNGALVRVEKWQYFMNDRERTRYLRQLNDWFSPVLNPEMRPQNRDQD
jgi:hypothetical protein